MQELLKITSDIEITRNEDGSINLFGYCDDVKENKEKIDKFVRKHAGEMKRELNKFRTLTNKNINVQWEYNEKSKCIFFSNY